MTLQGFRGNDGIDIPHEISAITTKGTCARGRKGKRCDQIVERAVFPLLIVFTRGVNPIMATETESILTLLRQAGPC